jgi:hypothetical protein
MKTTPKFDINRKDLYAFNSNLNDRTKNRLNEIASYGMEEVGVGQFGIKGVMSGLYIEKVWNYSDKDFNEYMDFVKDCILENELKRTV